MATPVDFSQEPEELECDSWNLPDDVGAFADVWAELLAVTGPESANSFVEAACADLGPDKLAARYGGISALRQRQSAELAPFVMVAGGGRPRLDPRVEDLLCYADSVKDFDKLGVLPEDRRRPVPEIEGLRSYLPDDFESLPRTNSAPCRAKIPYTDIKAALNPVLPAGCDDVTCRHKGAFSDFLKTSPELRFGEPIDNPFKGVDLHAGFCVIKDGRIRVRCDGTGNYIGDIPEQDLAALKAACAAHRTDGTILSVDFLNEVYADQKALLALEIADVCCHLRDRFGTTATFVVDNTFDEILTRFMLATREVDAAFMKRFRVGTDFERTVAEAVGEVHWTVALCDASMLDKRKITGAVTLEDETGDVYHADAAAQVTLKGVEFEKGKLRRPLNLLYAVDGVDSKIRVATDAFSISTTAIKVARGEDTIARLLALKRAADYGQVQHCATRNCVFVSTDELPCLYAHARGVPMLFLKSTSFKKSYGSEFLLQTTFVMNRPGDLQSGGGAPYVSMVASAVACAVIAFCLYMGS